MKKKVSVLVPTFNEEDNVEPISEAIIAEFEKLPQYDYELVFIDNCSKDETRNIIRRLCSTNPNIKAIFNARNYGQFNSPFYGLLQTTGDCTIAMCADFQDPPELIPEFIKWWEEGYKLVLGQRTSSKENRLIYRARLFYYKFMRKHSNAEILENVTGGGLYDRSFIDVMRGLDDPNPFIRGVVAEMGFGIKLVPFEQPLRRAGKSSNNFFTYFDAAMQSVTTYTKVGIRATIWTGMILTAASIVTIASTMIYKLLNWNSFSILPYGLDLLIFFVASLNIFFLGFIGEYIIDIKMQVRKRPLVVESERINFGNKDE